MIQMFLSTLRWTHPPNKWNWSSFLLFLFWPFPICTYYLPVSQQYCCVVSVVSFHRRESILGFGWENIVGFDIDTDSSLRWMSHLQFFIPALHFCHIISVTSRPGKPDRSSWFALIAVRTSSHCAAFHSSVPVAKFASVKVWGWMGLRKVKKELMVNSLTHYTAQRYTGFQY